MKILRTMFEKIQDQENTIKYTIIMMLPRIFEIVLIIYSWKFAFGKISGYQITFLNLYHRFFQNFFRFLQNRQLNFSKMNKQTCFWRKTRKTRAVQIRSPAGKAHF